MSMIGSCFLIGTFVGSFILPPAADVYGRKPVFLVGLCLFIVTVVLMMVCTNHYILYVLLVLGGISETGRYYVAYVYLVEIFPKRLQSNSGLFVFVSFSLCKASVCVYFIYSPNRQWFTVAYEALAFAIVSLLGTIIILPESPRFLAEK